LTTTDANRGEENSRIVALRDRLERGLREAVVGFGTTGDASRRVAGVLHASFPGVEAETLLVALDQRDIYAASGSACSSGAIDPSHVLLAMGMDRARALTCVRFSLGYASTDADVDEALEQIPAAVDLLVGVS
jgi:cysteine desulfurase